jgi:hypothetical protein
MGCAGHKPRRMISPKAGGFYFCIVCCAHKPASIPGRGLDTISSYNKGYKNRLQLLIAAHILGVVQLHIKES